MKKRKVKITSKFLLIPYEIYGEIFQHFETSEIICSLLLVNSDFYLFFFKSEYKSSACKYILFCINYKNYKDLLKYKKKYPYVKNLLINYKNIKSSELTKILSKLTEITYINISNCNNITNDVFWKLKP